ncbi:hypothetical protein C8J57DRAFT_58562 [Mycena rebaudengoi]|nr:hypothetical protein C8J57DRAFT_58562 [Mycena rebaudengoi]
MSGSSPGSIKAGWVDPRRLSSSSTEPLSYTNMHFAAVVILASSLAGFVLGAPSPASDVAAVAAPAAGTVTSGDFVEPVKAAVVAMNNLTEVAAQISKAMSSNKSNQHGIALANKVEAKVVDIEVKVFRSGHARSLPRGTLLGGVLGTCVKGDGGPLGGLLGGILGGILGGGPLNVNLLSTLDLNNILDNILGALGLGGLLDGLGLGGLGLDCLVAQLLLLIQGLSTSGCDPESLNQLLAAVQVLVAQLLIILGLGGSCGGCSSSSDLLNGVVPILAGLL